MYSLPLALAPWKVCVLFALFHDILFIFLGFFEAKPRFNELFMNYPVISFLVRLLDSTICTSRSVISSAKMCCSQTTAKLWSSENLFRLKVFKMDLLHFGLEHLEIHLENLKSDLCFFIFLIKHCRTNRLHLKDDERVVHLNTSATNLFKFNWPVWQTEGPHIIFNMSFFLCCQRVHS